MKKLILSLFFFLPLATQGVRAEKRTDGPPGSEWGDFSKWEGRLSLGAQFGAILYTNNDDSSFALGFDADFRPYDLFGVRGTFLQGVQSPRETVLSFTPLVHTEISNFYPYALFGPGATIIDQKAQGTNIRFSMTGGMGGDVYLFENYGFGMEWSYNWVIDAIDSHVITSRFSYRF